MRVFIHWKDRAVPCFTINTGADDIVSREDVAEAFAQCSHVRLRDQHGTQHVIDCGEVQRVEVQP